MWNILSWITKAQTQWWLLTSAMSSASYRASNTCSLRGPLPCSVRRHQPAGWSSPPGCRTDVFPEQNQRRGDRLLCCEQTQSGSLGSHFHCVPNNLCHLKILGTGKTVPQQAYTPWRRSPTHFGVVHLCHAVTAMFYLRCCFSGFENCKIGSKICYHGIKMCIPAWE